MGQDRQSVSVGAFRWGGLTGQRAAATAVVAIVSLLSSASTASATAYSFQDVEVDVEAWAGSGSQETILVVDWNKLDHGQSTVSASHAFGFRWDGQAYQSDMLTALDAAGVFDATVTTGGSFPSNIVFNDGVEIHEHIEPGSWNIAHSSDPFARWGTWGDSEWTYNSGGLTSELLVPGEFVGFNAIMFYDVVPDDADTSLQLDIPIVPEPVSAVLLALGSLGLFRRRSSS